MPNTAQAIKRVRQALRRRVVNRRARSAAKSLVQKATRIVSGEAEGEAPEAVNVALRALDRAAAKGIIHPNNAARRKSRLMAKANAAHLLEPVAEAAVPERQRAAGGKVAARKKVAAAKASKAAAGRSADRPRTAAGKARVAVTRASRETRARTRRSAGDGGPEGGQPG